MHNVTFSLIRSSLSRYPSQTPHRIKIDQIRHTRALVGFRKYSISTRQTYTRGKFISREDQNSAWYDLFSVSDKSSCQMKTSDCREKNRTILTKHVFYTTNLITFGSVVTDRTKSNL